MAMDNPLGRALGEMIDEPEDIWLAMRLARAKPGDPRDWPRNTELPIRFFNDIRTWFGCGVDGTIPVELASHGRLGAATLRYRRSVPLLEWDMPMGGFENEDGIGRLMVMAIRRGDPELPLWAWICRDDHQTDCGEDWFMLWEPGQYAYVRPGESVLAPAPAPARG